MSKASPFHRRLSSAVCFGWLKKTNGRWISVPLNHRRPPDPFCSRMWRYSRMAVKHRLTVRS